MIKKIFFTSILSITPLLSMEMEKDPPKFVTPETNPLIQAYNNSELEVDDSDKSNWTIYIKLTKCYSSAREREDPQEAAIRKLFNAFFSGGIVDRDKRKGHPNPRKMGCIEVAPTLTPWLGLYDLGDPTLNNGFWQRARYHILKMTKEEVPLPASLSNFITLNTNDIDAIQQKIKEARTISEYVTKDAFFTHNPNAEQLITGLKAYITQQKESQLTH